MKNKFAEIRDKQLGDAHEWQTIGFATLKGCFFELVDGNPASGSDAIGFVAPDLSYVYFTDGEFWWRTHPDGFPSNPDGWTHIDVLKSRRFRIVNTSGWYELTTRHLAEMTAAMKSEVQ